MTAARYDLIIDQGADFALQLTVKEDGSAKNISDSSWSIRAQLRSSSEAGSSQAFTTSKVDGVNGVISMSLPHATSTAMTAGTYKYDLELFDNSGDTQVIRLLQGTATIRREVTR